MFHNAIMVIKPEIEEDELAEHLDWYSQNFEHVDKVYCGSDLGEGCGELLALEASGPITQDARSLMKYADNRGVYRIVVGVPPKLWSTRVRLDETPDGKPMVGYWCRHGEEPNPDYEPAMDKYRKAVAAETNRHDKVVAQWREDNPDQLHPSEPAPQPNWPETPDTSPTLVLDNNTTVSEAELHHPPRAGWASDVSVLEAARIKQAIKDCGQHTPNYKEENGMKHYESFRLEGVK